MQNHQNESGRILLMRTKIKFISAAVATAKWATPTLAESPSEAAHEVLKGMTDYVSGLDTISFDYSVDLEAVTKKGIKLQFSASGDAVLDRPDKFMITRTGGHSDIELVSDGEKLTLYGRMKNAYAESKAPDSFDAFVNQAHSERGVEIPGADLLLANVHEELTAPVTEAMYLGTGIVDGVECEHLAFRTPEVDWQMWVATGDKPYPCKYVVTSKLVDAAPQYQLRVSNWSDTPDISSETFAFKPANGAKKIDLADMKNTDIMLPEATKGAEK
jgi:hypothetical protein